MKLNSNRLLVFGSQGLGLFVVMLAMVGQRSDLRTERPPVQKNGGAWEDQQQVVITRLWEDPFTVLDEMAEKEKMSEKEKNSSKSIGAIAAAVEKIAGTNDGRQRNAKISAKIQLLKTHRHPLLRFRVLLSTRRSSQRLRQRINRPIKPRQAKLPKSAAKLESENRARLRTKRSCF